MWCCETVGAGGGQAGGQAVGSEAGALQTPPPPRHLLHSHTALHRPMARGCGAPGTRDPAWAGPGAPRAQGQAQIRGWGSVPWPRGGRDPGGRAEPGGQPVAGGCRELGARITRLPACELFSSARFPVYTAAVPAACQGPQTPRGTGHGPGPPALPHWGSRRDGGDALGRAQGRVGCGAGGCGRPGSQEAKEAAAIWSSPQRGGAAGDHMVPCFQRCLRKYVDASPFVMENVALPHPGGRIRSWAGAESARGSAQPGGWQDGSAGTMPPGPAKM